MTARGQIVSLDAIKQRLAERLDSWLPAHFPNATRDRQLWRLGDISGAPGQSLAVYPDGHFYDFCTGQRGGAGGSVLDLWAAARRIDDFAAAVADARVYLGLGGSISPEMAERIDREAAEQRARAQAARLAEAEKMRRAARAIWAASRPLPGSPAEAYLLQRAIALAALPAPPASLRFHPDLKCPETGARRPAMVACVLRPGDGALIAIHRTFLEAKPGNVVVKASMEEAKRSLGGVTGGFIPLTRGASGRPFPQMPEGETPAFSEGIEDGLSAALGRPDWRIGAGVSLGNIATIELPPQAGGVILLGQNDTKPEAVALFESVRDRLAQRGRVLTPRPPAPIKDWNDWAQMLAGRKPWPEPMSAAAPREVCA